MMVLIVFVRNVMLDLHQTELEAVNHVLFICLHVHHVQAKLHVRHALLIMFQQELDA